MSIKDCLRPLYYKMYVCPHAEYSHRRYLKVIKEKGVAKVVFFASALSMWRYQGIYELLSKDTRFRTFIILCPFKTFSSEQKKESIIELRHYFDSRQIRYYDSTEWEPEQYQLKKWLDPDILFYVQPYSMYDNPLDWQFYQDKLLCYTPYGLAAFSSSWALNEPFQNVAWKLFYETDVLRRDAMKIAYNRGRNIIVTGNANADAFLKKEHKDVWKPQSKKKKRLIWAPHFSIVQGLMLQRGSFILLWEDMLRIAKEYSNDIQFAFKPHPRLRSMLYKHRDWGKERTDSYYNEWASMPNSQIEESSYIDLFMTSDAMIHDSGSFTVEYHYSHKPVLFFTQTYEKTRQQLNEFGRYALDAHYIAQTVDDVKRFIDFVVLRGEDSMRPIRNEFFNKFLLPPNSCSVAENMYNSIVETIWG